MGWSFSQIKQEPFRTQTSGLKPEVRASSFSSTEPPQTSFLTIGIIVGLVLLVVAVVTVVTGAVIWRKRCSGREGRERYEFSCLTEGFQAQVEVCLPCSWELPSIHMGLLVWS